VLSRKGEKIVAEIHYHGEYGVQVRFIREGWRYLARRFDTREAAVACAEAERRDLEGDGWRRISD
jgi:hypothetical protein